MERSEFAGEHWVISTGMYYCMYCAPSLVCRFIVRFSSWSAFLSQSFSSFSLFGQLRSDSRQPTLHSVCIVDWLSIPHVPSQRWSIFAGSLEIVCLLWVCLGLVFLGTHLVILDCLSSFAVYSRHGSLLITTKPEIIDWKSSRLKTFTSIVSTCVSLLSGELYPANDFWLRSIVIIANNQLGYLTKNHLPLP